MTTFVQLTGTQITAVLTTDTAAPDDTWLGLGDWAGYEDRPTPGFAPFYEGGQVVWRDPRSLDDIKAERWAAIKAQREVLDLLPITAASLGFAIDASATSRIDVMGALMSMQLTGSTSCPWRCADNVTRTLTQAQLAAFGTAIAARRQALVATSASLYDQIQAATTAADVAAVVWPT